MKYWYHSYNRNHITPLGLNPTVILVNAYSEVTQKKWQAKQKNLHNDMPNAFPTNPKSLGANKLLRNKKNKLECIIMKSKNKSVLAAVAKFVYKGFKKRGYG